MPIVGKASNGRTYAVKLRGGAEGVLASVVEWVSLKLGLLLSVPVLEPEVLVIDPPFLSQIRDPETRELVERSIGVNLGTLYRDSARPFHAPTEQPIDRATGDLIFLYDVFLLNVDRSFKNPNMMVEQDHVWCFDFASSVTMRSLIDGVLRPELVFLQHIRNHPFYRPAIDPSSFIRLLGAVDDQSIESVAESIPDDWVRQLESTDSGRGLRGIIAGGLKQLRDTSEELTMRMQDLHSVVPETEEEERTRLELNKELFQQRFGRL